MPSVHSGGKFHVADYSDSLLSKFEMQTSGPDEN